MLQMPFDDVVTGGETPDFSSPELEAAVTMSDGSRRAYRFVPEKSDEEETASRYLFTSSDHSQVFRVARYRIDALLNAKRARLVQKKSAGKASEEKSIAIDDAVDDDGEDT